MRLFLTAYLIAGLNKPMFKDLVSNPFCLKNAVNMFERTEIVESFYEGVVELSYKKKPGKIPTVLVTAVI